MREGVVYEHDPMTDKAILSDGYQLANKGVRLDSRACADHRGLLYLDKGADKDIVADNTAVEVSWLHHDDVLTKTDSSDANFLERRISHYLAPRRQRFE